MYDNTGLKRYTEETIHGTDNSAIRRIPFPLQRIRRDKFNDSSTIALLSQMTLQQSKSSSIHTDAVSYVLNFNIKMKWFEMQCPLYQRCILLLKFSCISEFEKSDFGTS